MILCNICGEWYHNTYVDVCTVKVAIYNLCGQRPPAFITKIPRMDDSVQKGLCGEKLPAERDQRPPNFACTGPFLNVNIPEYW